MANPTAAQPLISPLTPVPLRSVQLTDDFWQPRRRRNLAVTLISQWQRMEETGRLENFRRAARWLRGEAPGVEFQGIYFNDSDVAKWLEAACLALQNHDNPEGAQRLLPLVHDCARLYAEAQHPDGYINTYYSVERASSRWENLKDKHELYCAGHFFEAAIAHAALTGTRYLLDVAEAFAACIEAEFGWGKREQTDGHEEIELALFQLARATANPRWKDLAVFFMEVRGSAHKLSHYYQAHIPFVELREVTGHAVRALYYATAGADWYWQTGRTDVWEALRAQWLNFTRRRMHVSGGAGARYDGETFGTDYELPNQRAYAETCAAIASILFSTRMLQLEPQTDYADVLELALYNGMLAGISLDGEHYFYQNPLQDQGTHRRSSWFDCSCCPSNVARLLAQLPRLFYSTSERGIYSHLYASSRAQIPLPGGDSAVLCQQTGYPWDGTVTYNWESAPAEATSLYLRIPGWARGATVDGQEVEPGQYLELRRTWRQGETVTLQLPNHIRALQSHPAVMENTGRVALMRGPLLYCLEGCDHPGLDLRAVTAGPFTSWEAIPASELLGGVTLLRGRGTYVPPEPAWSNSLYLETDQVHRGPSNNVDLQAIPYYAWANRTPGQMQVWLLRGQG